MSFLLLLLSIGFIGAAGWGFESVMVELAKWHPQEPLDTLARRFEVDEFIWSSRAPLPLRRRYIVTQAFGLLAGLTLAGLVWLNEPRTDVRFWGAAVFCAISLLGASRLALKIIRQND